MTGVFHGDYAADPNSLFMTRKLTDKPSNEG